MAQQFAVGVAEFAKGEGLSRGERGKLSSNGVFELDITQREGSLNEAISELGVARPSECEAS